MSYVLLHENLWLSWLLIFVLRLTVLYVSLLACGPHHGDYTSYIYTPGMIVPPSVVYRLFMLIEINHTTNEKKERVLERWEEFWRRSWVREFEYHHAEKLKPILKFIKFNSIPFNSIYIQRLLYLSISLSLYIWFFWLILKLSTYHLNPLL